MLKGEVLRTPTHVNQQQGRGLDKGVVKPADEESGIDAAVVGADADGVGPCLCRAERTPAVLWQRQTGGRETRARLHSARQREPLPKSSIRTQLTS